MAGGTVSGAKARFGAICLFALAILSGGRASADDDYYMSKLETNQLRLLYYDPLQTYLTPYVARAFQNSVAFQMRMFDWTPWDKTTVMLQDLADNGGASMRATPNNGLTVDIAPISTTFETFSPGERFFVLMNHELVHVATMDVWNDQDAGWRHFFHGKPLPVTAHPESILYSYLAQPRTDVPRWYLEGSAVFMETWMGGGLGRAQGGYDEMVFRAMVRDDAHFFSPLGLPSEGNSVDFQVGANDYLYGTRFFSYLALTYGPEKVIAWLKRGPGQQGLLRRPVRICVRKAARPGLERLDRLRARIPEEEPRIGREISRDAGCPAHRPPARFGLAHFLRSEDRQPYRRTTRCRRDRQYQRRVAQGRLRPQADQHQGARALSRDVARL